MGAPDPDPVGRCELCGYPVWDGTNPQVTTPEARVGERHDPTGYCDGLILEIAVWSEELMAENQADVVAAREQGPQVMGRPPAPFGSAP